MASRSLDVYGAITVAYAASPIGDQDAVIHALKCAWRRADPTPLPYEVMTDLATPDRTLTRRTADVLAYFDCPGTSKGPTDAINGRLEHLCGSALGSRNFTNYIARPLLKTADFKPQLHPQLRKAPYGRWTLSAGNPSARLPRRTPAPRVGVYPPLTTPPI